MTADGSGGAPLKPDLWEMTADGSGAGVGGPGDSPLRIPANLPEWGPRIFRKWGAPLTGKNQSGLTERRSTTPWGVPSERMDLCRPAGCPVPAETSHGDFRTLHTNMHFGGKLQNAQPTLEKLPNR